MGVKRALDGLKILDFTWFQAGPMVTRCLANNGATVVKVESMQRPCVTRVSGPFKDDKSGINRSGYFAVLSVSKYSLALNMSHPRRAEVMDPLVRWCDACVENFSPGTMKRWGLDYENIRRINPGMVMLSMSMFGQDGPLNRHGAHGVHAVGYGGFTSITGWPGRDPVPPYGAYTDAIASRIGALCLMGALDYRKRTGKGQFIDLSQLEGSLHYLITPLLDFQVNGRVACPVGNASPHAAPHGVYRCRGEDRWCAISVCTEEEWRSFGRAAGEPWTGDGRFAALALRKQNEDELNRLVESWTARFSPEEVMSMLQSHGVSAGIVANGADLFADPQLEHRGFFQWFDHPELERYGHWGESFALSRTPVEAGQPAPLLGQHTEYVCREMLGMSDSQFVDLYAAGVFE